MIDKTSPSKNCHPTTPFLYKKPQICPFFAKTPLPTKRPTSSIHKKAPGHQPIPGRSHIVIGQIISRKQYPEAMRYAIDRVSRRKTRLSEPFRSRHQARFLGEPSGKPINNSPTAVPERPYKSLYSNTSISSATTFTKSPSVSIMMHSP